MVSNCRFFQDDFVDVRKTQVRALQFSSKKVRPKMIQKKTSMDSWEIFFSHV